MRADEKSAVSYPPATCCRMACSSSRPVGEERPKTPKPNPGRAAVQAMVLESPVVTATCSSKAIKQGFAGFLKILGSENISAKLCMGQFATCAKCFNAFRHGRVTFSPRSYMAKGRHVFLRITVSLKAIFGGQAVCKHPRRENICSLDWQLHAGLLSSPPD